MPTQLWRTSGTSIDDFIVLADGSDTVNGGTGDDLIIGDGPTPFQFGTTNDPMAPANLDSPIYWSTIENPLFGDANIPHTSLYVRGDAGEYQYASVTVGAGETIRIDIDFARYSNIGVDVDPVVVLYDSMGNPLVINDDAPYFTEEGAGSSSTYDSYLTYTNLSGTDQTYTIRFGYYGGSSSGDPFTGGQTFVANLSVTGHASTAPSGGDDVLVGGFGDDTVIGQLGNDQLYGREGSDQLFGGSGNDIIDGGDGFDTAWYNDATSGAVIDLRRVGAQNTSSAGSDTLVSIEGLVGSAYNDILLGSDDFNNIRGGGGDDTLSGYGSQDLLYGERGSDTIFGGDGDDHITGDVNDYSDYYGDTLFGEGGNDVVNGWLGNDRLYGGDGDDIFYEAGGNDIIDGGDGIDELQYNGGFGPLFVDLSITTVQNTGQGMDTITGIENLLGTSNDDSLTGNDQDNRLNGWWGNDTLIGGAGDDRLIGDTGNDTLIGGFGLDTADYSTAGAAVTVNLANSGAQNTGGAGTDTLFSMENLQGSYYNDTLYGSTGDNIISGYVGNDTIRGQGGDDTLNGDAGDDTLNGGNGNDYMDGGDGTDTVTYAGNSVGVTVSLALSTAQNTGQGNDTLVAIENIIGTSFADTLTGDSNANRLTGGAGADTMSGGGGNDVYVVDNAGDVVNELAGGGTDTVQSSVGYSLGNNVERLTLTGSANVNAVGNSLNNVITGNSGDNIVVGGLGNDTLTGGAGADLFRFNDALNGSSNRDKITDFVGGTDRIQLDDDIFTHAGSVGTLASGAFYTGAAAHDADDRIVYDATTGNIYYDADGNGAGAAILFAQVTAGLILQNTDFEVIG